MTKQNSADDDLLYFLKERAKELDCIYQVDELLGNQRLSWPEIFEEIVRVLPLVGSFLNFARLGLYTKTKVIILRVFSLPPSHCAAVLRLTKEKWEGLRWSTPRRFPRVKKATFWRRNAS
jgi:hypothetical protein